MTEEPTLAGPRRLLRRLPLLVVIGVLAWLFLGDRPREVTLVWDLPDDPAPSRADVTVRAPSGEAVAGLRWGGASGPARDRQAQRALLAPGRYDYDATLTWPSGEERRVFRSFEVTPEDEQIVLHLR